MLDARIQRLIKIRKVQLNAARAKLAKSEAALRLADEARALAQSRLDVVLGDALEEGSCEVDDLVERRARVDWEARLLKEAVRAATEAQQVREDHVQESRSMSLKMRQAESMAEAALRVFLEDEARRDRARNDEFASGNTSAARERFKR